MTEVQWRDGALVAGAAAVAALPGLLPGAEFYLDSPAHLLECSELAQVLLPAGSLGGWTEAANGGTSVGLVNAPLAWLPLAALVKVGLPLVPTYLLASFGSAVVFALAAWAALRRFVGPAGAVVGALLLATWPADLYGVGGALGGMWPFRLALALLLAGLAAPRSWPLTALGLALLLPLHTFVGVVAFAGVGFGMVGAALRRDSAAAGRSGLTILWGAAASAWFWWPLLDPAMRSFGAPWRAGLLEAAALPLLPIDIRAMLTDGGLPLVGGLLAVPATIALLGGAARGSARLPRAARGVVGFGLAVAAAGAALQWAGSDLLGPNPWRHLVHGRIALAALAGAGLASWFGTGRRRAALAAGLALCGAAIGSSRVPNRVADGEVLAALEATWDQLPEGTAALYHDDGFGWPPAPSALQASHPGGLAALRTGIPVWGSWYGIAPTATARWSLMEGGMLSGRPRADVEDPAAWMAERMLLYGVPTLLTMDPGLASAISNSPAFEPRGGVPPFALFGLTRGLLSPVGVHPDHGVARDVKLQRGRVQAQLDGAAAIPFRVRRAWNPGWRGTLDGEPVPLQAEDGTGLIQGSAPRAGQLELRWEAPSRGNAPLLSLITLLGLLAAIGRPLAASGELRAAARKPPTPSGRPRSPSENPPAPSGQSPTSPAAR